jgi:hypothetical protein
VRARSVGARGVLSARARCGRGSTEFKTETDEWAPLAARSREPMSADVAAGVWSATAFGASEK